MNNNVIGDDTNDVAIIGMVCRFPGVNDVDEFWEVIKDGVEVIHRDKEGVSLEYESGDMIHVNTVMNDAEMFDAPFFGFTEKEAEVTDPQHRMFLEGSCEILEKAGYNSLNYEGMIGIYAGVSTSTYLMNNILGHQDIVKSVGSLQLMIGNDKDHMTSKVAYKLDLKGPCVTVQSACSTSLVAVHMASESLLNGQCDMVIAGGITIKYPQVPGYHYQQGGLVSNDGHLRPFDSNAAGTVYSNGMGIVLLKRMADAVRDKDQIYAVIKGTAVGNDGTGRVGYTAPGVDGQVRVMIEAQSVAGVKPEDISYIEAHGSGTPLGDGIELDAMHRAFRTYTQKNQFCAIGSVKANIGHTEMACGAASLIKTALALKNRQIPPSINYEEPNPKLDVENTPFYVNTFLCDWDSASQSRMAGVSSFGLGGTNCHVILKEAPEQEEAQSELETELLLISAKTQNALNSYIANMKEYIRNNADISLSDLAYTMKVGRKRFEYKSSFVFQNHQELLEKLSSYNDGDIDYGDDKRCSPIFLNETGILWEDIRKLYYSVKEYQIVFDPINNWLKIRYGKNLLDEMCDNSRLFSFIAHYTCAVLLQRNGVVYEGAYVQGAGEYVYLCLTGKMEWEQAVNHIWENSDILTDEIYRYSGSLKTRKQGHNIPIGKSGNQCYNFQKLMAHLWRCNVEIDWRKYYKENGRRRILAPTYPFEHQLYKIAAVEPPGTKLENRNSVVEADSEAVFYFSRDDISYESVQTVLVSIWEKALGQKITDRNLTFFELGGHSLLATQVLFTTCTVFKTEIPLEKFFESPTIANFTKVIIDYLISKENKYEPLEQLEIDLEHRYDPFPLTDIQKAYWVGRKNDMELGNISTHMYIENDLAGLDIEKFNRIFNQLIKYNEMLRAVILPDGTQRILEETPEYQIGIFDMADSDDLKLKEHIDAVRREMSHQMIDCTKWPLFDVRATLMPDNVARIHISIDLLIADAWSLELLFNQVGVLYDNPDYKYDDLQLSFRDYVLYLKNIENTQNYEKSKQYWKNRIEDLPAGPQLQLAKKPAMIEKPEFCRLTSGIDKAHWRSLKMKASQYGITTTVMLLSAFSEVLLAWSKKPRFTLNLTLFNRLPVHPQINDIMGDFTSLNLLEINCQKRDSFINRARQNQIQLLKDIDNRYYSGISVSRDLMAKYKDPERAIIPVVFTSLLNQVDANMEQENAFFSTSGAGLNDDPYSISQTPQVWLDHQVIEKNNELHFNWDVVKELFADGMIDDMIDAYCKLLTGLAESDDLWREVVPLECKKVNAVYRTKLDTILSKHLNTSAVSGKMLHSGFLETAQQKGSHIAIETSTRSITYEQLNRCADVIAANLIKAGGVKNKYVCIIMEKGWEEVAAAIGILKAQGTYIPIDAKWPEERINKIIEIGNVETVIVRTAGDTMKLPPGVHIHEVSEEMLFGKADQTEVLNDPGSLAYVIFTSGSTGIPKGVMISHESAVNTIEDINSRFQITDKDKIFGISSLNFDLSVYDVFGIFAAGGTLVLPDPDKLKDPSHWDDMMKKTGVTIWNSVPALMRMFVEYLQSKVRHDTLRLVMMSGDWIPLGLPDDVKTLGDKIDVISLGGATEASIWSILYPIETINKEWSSIPYGISMDNQIVYVMNENLQVNPVGVTGEICIGGIGVAKGYLGDEENTRVKFVIHPDTGERLYKTGDYGKYMPDGNIEFLGRQDMQVKISGYRIELGEIESVIQESEYVKDAVVVVGGDEARSRHIDAYIIADTNRYYGIEELNEERIITDKIQRMTFKLEEPAIRRFEDNKKIQLEQSSVYQKDYFKRRSFRYFTDEQIPFSDFAHLLSCMVQDKIGGMPFPKYLYASAGGLYPVQVYIHIANDRIEGIPGAVYYYNPKEHCLVKVSDQNISDRKIHTSVNHMMLDTAAFSIYLIGDLNAIKPMYGKAKSIEYMLIESGLMTQLLESEAYKYEIGLCQIGKVNSDIIKSELQLDENSIFLHCLLGGRISQHQLTKEGFIEEGNGYENTSENNEDAEPQMAIEEVVQGYLKEKLPSYMVPANIVTLNEFPLSQNGKVDKKALIALGKSKLSQKGKADLVLPNNKIEKKLMNIWKGIFSDREFGIRDNFFDLGGDSIAMVAVFNQIEREITDKLTIIDLFSFPTIESLSGLIDQIGLSADDETEKNMNI